MTGDVVGVSVVVGTIEATSSVGDGVSTGAGPGAGGICGVIATPSSQTSTEHRPNPCVYAQHCSRVSYDVPPGGAIPMLVQIPPAS